MKCLFPKTKLSTINDDELRLRVMAGAALLTEAQRAQVKAELDAVIDSPDQAAALRAACPPKKTLLAKIGDAIKKAASK